MNFYILTLFPEMINNTLNHSIIKRAIESEKIKIRCIDIRDFPLNKHGQVDDTPYGGGVGMVMSPLPVYNAYMSIKKELAPNTKVIYMSPHGKPLNQKKVSELSHESDIVLLCGHYEGIDQRVIDEIVTDEISIGDFILTGGELAACVIVDAVSRLLPNVLGNDESFMDESFSDGLLEYPQYTKPLIFLDNEVPDILLSGHHKNIEKWRHEKSIEVTKIKRPDLLNRYYTDDK